MFCLLVVLVRLSVLLLVIDWQVSSLFFFFQAEDGIRDWSVTGVQTCALPISVGSATVAHGWSAHFQEFTPLFHFKVPDIVHTAPVNYCVNVGAGCPHTGFVATGSYFDLPAILITFILTIILVKGIRESASFNAFMVAV